MPKSRRLRAKTLAGRVAAHEKLRTGLAELGYYVLPLSRRFRNHRLDFVAVRKDSPNEFFLVRRSAKGNVTIQPYSLPTRHPAVNTLVRDVRREGHLVGWKPQVHIRERNLGLEHFLSEAGEREYRELIKPIT